jgi:cell division septum initiation protein DivIVA
MLLNFEKIKETNLSLKKSNDFLEEHVKDYQKLLNENEILKDQKTRLRTTVRRLRIKNFSQFTELDIANKKIKELEERLDTTIKDLIKERQLPLLGGGQW